MYFFDEQIISICCKADEQILPWRYDVGLLFLITLLDVWRSSVAAWKL